MIKMWILTIFRIKRFHIKMYILKRDTKQKQENLEPRNSHPSLLPTCYDLSGSLDKRPGLFALLTGQVTTSS